MTLTWPENCILTDITTEAADLDAYPTIPAKYPPTNATFQITDTKLYVPVVTLSTKDHNNFLEQLKSGFKRTVKWIRYRSEMTNQIKTSNVNLIDPTFTKVNRFFVLSFGNEKNRTSF